jgi:hypothetical protein
MKRKYSQSEDNQLQDALDCLEQNPDAKVATIAKEFGVSRDRLRSRLSGYNSAIDANVG